MKKKTATLIFLLMIMIVGCAGTGGYPTPAAVDGYGNPVLDSRATYTVAENNMNATRAVADNMTQVAQEATAVSVRQTMTAVENATATAVANVEAATATGESVAIRATEQHLSLEGTRISQGMMMQATSEAYNVQATATSQAIDALVVAAELRDEERRLEIQRDSEVVSIERARLWNTVWPYFLSLIIVCLASGIAVWFYVQNRKIQMMQQVMHVRQEPGMVAMIRDQNGQARIISPSRQPLALPEPEEGEIVESGSDFSVLEALHGEQAILVHGPKGTGKTTVLRWLMSARQNPVIIDPHAAPGDWPNCVVVGGGRKFDEIGDVLERIESLMSYRYQQIHAGDVRRGQHETITLFIDEQRAIRQNVDGSSAIIQTLLTEARKSQIDIILVNHSKNVKALGMDGEGDLREGFAFLHLRKVNGRYSAAVTYGSDEAKTSHPVQLIGEFDAGIEPVYPANNAANLLGLPQAEYVAPPQHRLQPEFASRQPASKHAPDLSVRLKDKSTLNWRQVSKIREMKEAGHSLTDIQDAVIGYNGGTAFYAVKEVLRLYPVD